MIAPDKRNSSFISLLKVIAKEPSVKMHQYKTTYDRLTMLKTMFLSKCRGSFRLCNGHSKSMTNKVQW